MKKNTEKAIVTAIQEMSEAGIPVTSFEPCDSGQGYDFVFSKGLTPKQQEKAKQIATKYIDAEWGFETP